MRSIGSRIARRLNSSISSSRLITSLLPLSALPIRDPHPPLTHPDSGLRPPRRDRGRSRSSGTILPQDRENLRNAALPRLVNHSWDGRHQPLDRCDTLVWREAVHNGVDHQSTYVQRLRTGLYLLGRDVHLNSKVKHLLTHALPERGDDVSQPDRLKVAVSILAHRIFCRVAAQPFERLRLQLSHPGESFVEALLVVRWHRLLLPVD